MNAQLEKQFAQLEDHRKMLFNDLKKYSDEVLNKKPSADAWSVTEVMNHLMASEGASLRYLQKKTLDTSKAQKAGLKGAWKLFLLKAAFTIPYKFKAPEVVEPSHEFASLADSEKKWTHIRTETYKLLNGLKDADHEKEIWKHAFGGKMNIYQMFDFFDFHFIRHKKQIERTLKSVT